MEGIMPLGLQGPEGQAVGTPAWVLCCTLPDILLRHKHHGFYPQLGPTSQCYVCLGSGP